MWRTGESVLCGRSAEFLAAKEAEVNAREKEKIDTVG